MSSSVNLKAAGLTTQQNQLETPEGGLTEASNVIIQREDIIEPRRGFGLFGNSFGTLTDRLKQLFVYKFRLLRYWGTTLEFDTGTVDNAGDELFSPFSGSFIEAQEGLRTKSVESNGNFYFTSLYGIQKISAATASQLTTDPGFITPAGGIKALDLSAAIVPQQGNITGFLPQDSTVAYRVVWGTNDNNKNLILGVPSQRAEVYNYLSDLTILDVNNTLQEIQNTANQTGGNASIINQSDYVSALGLAANASPTEILNALIALASKLDNNILLAEDIGGFPLQISAIDIVNSATNLNNVATITFSSGTPTNYWTPGSNIFLTGFPVGENGIDYNGVQTLSAVTATTASFLTDATGNSQTFNSTNVDIVTDTFTINSHGFKNADPVRLTNSGGALPTPLAAGTTYYVGSITANTFQLFTTSALGTPINITAAGSGTDTIVYFMPVSATSINSGEFRSIAQPANPSNPATDAQMTAIQTYLSNIIQVLQSFPTTGTPPIISAFSQTNFISGLDITTSANVLLNITIPQDVTTNYFFQVYRSPVLQATGTTALADLTASDELQLAYEAYPTQQDINNGFVTFLDITPDLFLGADLYTNQASGVGIANANETPPFALDINRFKNVTFYANTHTKYRMSLNLLGISKMVQDYNSGTTPTLVISDGGVTNVYSFVVGVQQITNIMAVADVANSLNGKYFLINSADDAVLYYVWYKTSGGVTSDPMIAGRTGVEVFINTGDSANTVAAKTRDALNTILGSEFVATTPALPVIVVTNVGEGYTTSSSAGTSGFTVTTPTPGVGQKLSQSSANFTTVADVAGSLAGKYWTINAAFNFTEYYIWYRVSGAGTDPGLSNKTGIRVDLVTNDSAATVASKTAAALNLLPTQFVASSVGNSLTVNSFTYGPSLGPSVGTSGFILVSSTSGYLQVLLSNKTSAGQAVDETARSLVNVINRNKGEILYAFYLSQSSTVPGQMTLESRDLTTPQYFLSANNSDTGSSFNPDLSPTIAISSITTGNSLTNVVTTVSPHGMMTNDQVMISGTDSVPLADGLHTITYLSPTTFRINETILTAATKGNMIPAVDANAGDNETKPNRIYYSRFQQPEAVPLPNTIDVGDADKPILRILPLRDTLFVFKEEGLYRISGEIAPFTLQLFDTSCMLIAPDSLSVAKNVAYGWTTQGILSITEAGVSNPPISRAIDVNILPLNDQNYPSFSTSTWGVGYDSDNSYIVYTVTDPNDTEATIAYRYSTLTSTWTTFDKTNTCGIVNITDDKLYLGAGDINYIEQERKNYNRFDYADREIDSILNNGLYFGNVIQLPDVSKISVGDALVQNQDITVYGFNSLLKKLDVDTALQTNTIAAMTTGLTPTITTVGNHFLSTGDYISLTGTTTTPLIDGIYKVTVLNPTQFQITVASPILTSSITGLIKYNYFTTLQVAGGVSFKNAQTALSARLNIEPGLIYKSSISTIVSNSIANPTVLTLSAPHSLGDVGTIRKVNISGVTGSVPSINGDFDVTVIDTTHVSLPVNVTIAGTGGSLQTIDDYVNSISSKSGVITNITVANPTVVTAPNHGMVSNRYIQIAGTDSTPTLNGNYTATIIDNNTFTIPVGVLIAGTTGSFSTLDGTFQDTLVNYNYIISILNADPGTSFNNYMPISTTTSFEAIIIAVNKATKQITTEFPLDYIVGPLSIFKAINSTFTYSPVTFKDPLNLKQVSEATLMFENKAFSSAELAFKSDLIPEFLGIPFKGTGNGSFGLGIGKFGGNFFGGGSNAAPFRTLIPRDAQRCRYIVPKFTHSVALEKYIINGLTLSGNIGQSTRAYR